MFFFVFGREWIGIEDRIRDFYNNAFYETDDNIQHTTVSKVTIYGFLDHTTSVKRPIMIYILGYLKNLACHRKIFLTQQLE